MIKEFLSMHLRILAVIAVVVSVACSGSQATEPGRSLNGTYVLASVNDRALPARVFANLSGSQTTDVIGGELAFEGADTVGRRIRWLNTDRGANSELVYQRFGRVRYRVDGNLVIFEAGGNYSRPDTGILSGTAIRVRADVQTEGELVSVQALYHRQ